VDKFRLKIWNKANGVVVYDSQDADLARAGFQLGAPDDADPNLPINSGVIQIFPK
jgi:hypothetical protein